MGLDTVPVRQGHSQVLSPDKKLGGADCRLGLWSTKRRHVLEDDVETWLSRPAWGWEHQTELKELSQRERSDGGVGQMVHCLIDQVGTRAGREAIHTKFARHVSGCRRLNEKSEIRVKVYGLGEFHDGRNPGAKNERNTVGRLFSVAFWLDVVG